MNLLTLFLSNLLQRWQEIRSADEYTYSHKKKIWSREWTV